MTGYDGVDPALVPLAAMALWPGLLADALPTARANAVAGERIPPVPEALVREEVAIPHGDGVVPAVLLRRRQGPARGAILHMHGGGYLFGSPAANEHENRRWTAELGFVVLSVDYRLAPEHRFPCAIEDCYAAMRWLVARAEIFGFDAGRIAVAGESAGGGLAAALALLARDRGEVAVAYQSLLAPMLDDRTVTRGALPGTGHHVWTAESNRFGWESMLGHDAGHAATSSYAAAARAGSLAGLPPTYIAVGALDLFVREDVDYAARLLAAGVEAELHVYPGVIHAFELAAAFKAPVALRALAERRQGFERAFPERQP